jgi:antitoxin component YwqK of YwqJK toxin-antitoxin module
MKLFAHISILLILLFLFSCGNKNFTEVVVEQYDDGNPKVVQRTFVKKTHEAHVIEVHFYPDGALHMEGPIVKGNRHGQWRSWYADGVLWSEGWFEQGKRQGKGIVYHPSGLKHIEGEYTNGEKSGIWQTWDETGTLISTVDFSSQPE